MESRPCYLKQICASPEKPPTISAVTLISLPRRVSPCNPKSAPWRREAAPGRAQALPTPNFGSSCSPWKPRRPRPPRSGTAAGMGAGPGPAPGPTAASAGGRSSGARAGTGQGRVKSGGRWTGRILKLWGGEAGAARSAATGGATLIGAAWPRRRELPAGWPPLSSGRRWGRWGARQGGRKKRQAGRKEGKGCGGPGAPGQLRPHLLRSSAGPGPRQRSPELWWRCPPGRERGRARSCRERCPPCPGRIRPAPHGRSPLPVTSSSVTGSAQTPRAVLVGNAPCLCWLTAESLFASQQLSVSALCEVRTTSHDTEQNQGSCNYR